MIRAAISKICMSCGLKNPPTRRRCKRCGNPL